MGLSGSFFLGCPIRYLRLEFKQVLSEAEFLFGFVVGRMVDMDVQAAREGFFFAGEDAISRSLADSAELVHSQRGGSTGGRIERARGEIQFRPAGPIGSGAGGGCGVEAGGERNVRAA